jgi:neutral ceramidase
MRKSVALVIVCCFFSLTDQHASGKPGSYARGWKAGAATVVITPEESVWMAGYAARNRPAEGTLHDLKAKALAIEDANGELAVLVTTDLIGFRGNYMSGRIIERLGERYGLASDQVILSSSHTHTGPELMRPPEDDPDEWDMTGYNSPEEREKIIKYSLSLEDKIVDLVGEALNLREPARLFSGHGVARFAVNRRNNAEADLRPGTQLAGPADHSVPVLKVAGESGEILAVVFGYACHATVLSFYKWSGDYPGFAQIALEKTFPGTTAMFFAGAGADQNPLPRRSVALANQYGTTLAAAVEAVISEPMKELSPHLITAFSRVNLKFANPSPTEEELLKILEESSGYPEYLKASARVLLRRLEKGNPLMVSYDYPIQFWRIGEQNMVILGGEVVVDYSIVLRQILGEDLFVMAYANEGMGYIPSSRILSEGGYEGSRSPVFTSPWAADIEIRIIQEVIRLAGETGIRLSAVE